MKYEEEFNKYSKEDFIKVLTRVYEVQPKSAYRAWYKVRMKLKGKKNKIVPLPKTPVKVVIPHYTSEQKEEPSRLKILEADDIIRLMPKDKVTRKLFMKYGFNTPQINWLIDAGYNIADDS